MSSSPIKEWIDGPCTYQDVQLRSGSWILLLGDIHGERSQPCPGPTVSLAAFLDKVLRENPERDFNLLLETPKPTYNFPLQRHRREGLIQKVYDYFSECFRSRRSCPYPNLYCSPMDVRVKGLNRDITRIEKAYAFCTSFENTMWLPGWTTTQRDRFLKIVQGITITFPKLWKTLKLDKILEDSHYRENIIYNHFQDLFSELLPTPQEIKL